MGMGVSVYLNPIPGFFKENKLYGDYVIMIADKQGYLFEISELLKKEWPNNRAVNIVCHGHSVPAGYF